MSDHIHYIYVFGISNLLQCKFLRLDFRTFPTVWYLLFFNSHLETDRVNDMTSILKSSKRTTSFAFIPYASSVLRRILEINMLLQSGKIEDIFHSCQKFYVLFPCSIPFHSGKDSISQTRRRYPSFSI